jgi:hypothetical protein
MLKQKVALIVALLAVVSLGTPKKVSPKIVPQMSASLRYDWITDAALWLEVKMAPFQYLHSWSGRTP